MNISVSPKALSKPFSVSTLVGDPFIDRTLYKKYPIIVDQKVTSEGLVELVMVDIDIILRMYWLHSSYSSLDCRTMIIIFFQFPSESILK